MTLRELLENPELIDLSYKWLYAIPVNGDFTLDSPIGYNTRLIGGNRFMLTEVLLKRLQAGENHQTIIDEVNSLPRGNAARSKRYRLNNPDKIKQIESSEERRKQRALYRRNRKLRLQGIDPEEYELGLVEIPVKAPKQKVEPIKVEKPPKPEPPVRAPKRRPAKTVDLSKPIGNPKKLAKEAAKKRKQLIETPTPKEIKRELSQLELLASKVLKTE